MLLLMILL